MTNNNERYDLLAATTALLPLIRDSRDESEDQRRLSGPVVEGMADAGIFRAFYPKSLGGLEVDPMTMMKVVEDISIVDGSTGWCAMITSDTGLLGGRFKHSVAAELFGRPPDVRVAGTVVPRGQAREVDGGFRIGGHFTFASGIDYANWVVCTCVVTDDSGPVMTDLGTPRIILAIMPVGEADVRKTWTAAGMCATGSHDFHVDDFFVPSDRAFGLSEQTVEPGPLYDPRLLLVFGWSTLAACLMGIGRGAMDAFLESVAGSGSNMSPTLIRDRPAVHTAVGSAEAALSSARAYLYDAMTKVWTTASDGAADLGPEITQARLAITVACRESTRAVDLLFEAAGTTAVYKSHPIERYHRDIHVANKHWGGNAANFDMAGQVILGLKPSGPGW